MSCLSNIVDTFSTGRCLNSVTRLPLLSTNTPKDMMLLEEGMIETDDGKKTKAGGENFKIGGDMSFYSWNFNLEKIMKKN